MWKEYEPGEGRVRTEPEKLSPNESDYEREHIKKGIDWEEILSGVGFFLFFMGIASIVTFCLGTFITTCITAGIKGAQ